MIRPLSKKEILAEFRRNGLELRPASVVKIEEEQADMRMVRRLIETVKSLYNQNTELDTLYVEPDITEDSIRMLKTDRQSLPKGGNVKEILQNKFMHSLILLDNITDVPVFYFDHHGVCHSDPPVKSILGEDANRAQ